MPRRPAPPPRAVAAPPLQRFGDTGTRSGATDARDGLVLAMLARKRMLVLIAPDDASRKTLLEDLLGRIAGDGAFVLAVTADVDASVERLVVAAAGERETDVMGLAAQLEERLDAAGAGLLAIDRAERLGHDTLLDLFSLAQSPTPGGRTLQVLLVAAPSIERRLASPEIAAAMRDWGAVYRVDDFGSDEVHAFRSPAWAMSPPASVSAPGVAARLGGIAAGAMTAFAVLFAFAMVVALATSDPSAFAGRLQNDVMDLWRSVTGAVEPTSRSDAPDAPSGSGPAWVIPAPVPSPDPVPAIAGAEDASSFPPVPFEPEVEAPPPVRSPTRPLPAIPPPSPDSHPAAAPAEGRSSPPDTAPAAQTPGDRIAALADRGRRQVAVRHLTSPPGDNAFETLEAIRGLEPDAEVIAELRAAIKSAYRRMGERAEDNNNWEEARRYYERALRVDPDDPEFLARWHAAGG